MKELPFRKEQEAWSKNRPFWLTGCLSAWILFVLAFALFIGFGTYEQRTLFRWVGSTVLCLLFILAYGLTLGLALPRKQRAKSLAFRLDSPKEEKSGTFLRIGKMITLSGQGKGKELFFQNDAGQTFVVYWDPVEEPSPFQEGKKYRLETGQRFVLAYEETL